MPEKIWWSMHDLEQMTGRKYLWLTRHILFRPEYRKMLDVDHGGPVYYPRRTGDRWLFLRGGIEKFISDHFTEIFGRKNNSLRRDEGRHSNAI